MLFLLSKLLTFLTQPFIWLVILVIWAYFTSKEVLRKWLLISAAILLFFFSNGFILNQFIKVWEVKPKQLSELKSPYDYAIVLGGMGSRDPAYDRIRFNGASDRIWQAVDLYKKGLVKKLILSGGSGYVLYPNEREMVFLKDYLTEIGIPGSDILTDTLSRNTHENAINVKKMFYEPGSSYLLITSGYHMRRALACFRQEGIPVTSYAADLWSPIKHRFDPGSLLPSAGSLAGWEGLMREMVGYVVYDVVGYY